MERLVLKTLFNAKAIDIKNTRNTITMCSCPYSSFNNILLSWYRKQSFVF